MKITMVTTESGSVYIFKEENSKLYCHIGMSIDNPNVTGLHKENWYLAEVVPWPPVVDHDMIISRSEVPWGEGQLKRTSIVKHIAEE